MESKPRFYIYEKKEILLLIILGVTVAVFSFTLGIHMGKRISIAHPLGSGPAVQAPVQTAADHTPPSEELSEQAPRVSGNVDEFMNESLKSEVVETGAALKQRIQVDLPTTKKSVVKAPAPAGRFAVQVGSYPSADEAAAQQKALREKGLETVVRAIDLKGKGRRFRLLVEGFATAEDAERAGQQYRAEQKIAAFVVTPVAR